MASALLEQVTVDIADPTMRLRLRANGSVVIFDGFLALYQEDRDDTAEEEGEGARLPAMRQERAAGARARSCRSSTSRSRRRATPRRASSRSSKSSASAVLRPMPRSCRSCRIATYVRLEKRRFIPEDRGRLVTAFLTNFFERYVEYGFTADLENQLDDVSGGRTDWKEVLRNFWRDFQPLSTAPRS